MTREEAVARIKDHIEIHRCHERNAVKIFEALDMAIKALEQPEVVRCGQCKYAEVADAQDNQDGYTCRFHRGSIWFSGSYCSWAERKLKNES